MKSYISGVVGGYFHLAISMVIAIVLIPFLLKKIGSELTGVYLLLMTISGFLSVGIGWLSGAGVKLLVDAHALKESDYLKDVHWIVFIGYFLYASVMLVACVGASTQIGKLWFVSLSPQFVDQARWACVFLGVFIWVSYIQNADLSLFTATFRQGTANLYRALAQVVFAISAFSLLSYSSRVDLLMLSQVAGVLVVGILVRIHLSSLNMLSIWKPRRLRKDVAHSMFVSVGGAYFVFGLVQFLLLYGDVFIIGTLMGSSAVTSYILLWKIPEVLGVVLGRLSETLSPHLTKLNAIGDSVALRGVFVGFSKIQACLALAAGSAYAILGPYIAYLWVGDDQRHHEWIYYLIAGLALSFQVMNRHNIILHFALAKVRGIIFPQLLEFTLKLLLVIILLQKWGVAAPLLAYLIVQVFGFYYWYLRLAMNLVQIDWLYWFREVGVLIFLLAIAMGGAILSVGQDSVDLRLPGAASVAMYISISSSLILFVWDRYGSSVKLNNIKDYI